MTELHIKHMVCPRCISAVETALAETGMAPISVELGRVELETAPSENQLTEFQKRLQSQGFELLSDTGNQLVLNIKNQLLAYLDQLEAGKTLPLKSAWLEEKLHKNYSYLSERFSTFEGITIEQFWIRLKCERAKELLENNELSITEIAFRLGYSSSQYFANQFKSQTGMKPGEWRKSGKPRSGRVGLTGK